MDGIEVRFQGPTHPVPDSPRGTLWHILQNYAKGPAIHEFIHLLPTEAGADDIQLAERLMTAHLRTREYEMKNLAPADRPNAGIWEMTKHEFHGDIYGFLAARDTRGFAGYMRNAMREKATHGLGPGRQVFNAFKEGEGRESNIVLLIDRLAALAEAVGVLPHENPEQGRYGANITLSATDLVDRTEAAIGAKIGRGRHMGNFGLVINGDLIDVRVPDDAYTIFRAKQVAETLGLSGMCEIGGGLGGNAIQALRMGIPNYTIVDIPIVSLIQGWFLIKHLGADKVSLFGEEAGGRPVRVAPYWEFFDRASKFDLVINRDSMPEFSQEHATAYVKEIADRRAYFLSINQEGCGPTGQPDMTQLWVGEIVRSNGTMKRLSRHKAWTRAGYVEEIFAPNR